jgi:hypothetical protein
MTDLSRELIDGLEQLYKGNIAAAKANVKVYLKNPMGIGEHPDIIQSIDTQIEIIANNQEKLDILNSRQLNLTGENFPVE